MVEAAVEAARRSYRSLPGVVNIREGLHLVNGQYSTDPAVIVSIDYANPGSDATVTSLPASVLSFPLQVRAASAEDLVRARGNIALEGVPRINYQEPGNLSLDAVEDEMFAVFHVSPDAGWPQLQEFLSRTRQSLTIGLYNFATEHVEAALLDAVSQDPRTFDLVLGDAGIDRAHTDEFEARIVEEFGDLMGDRFRFELADGQRRLFAGHYHIKVAVRDSRAFWLSSGNWEPSNQPDVDPVATGETSFELLEDRNREWHAVVLNERLAQTFEAYIEYDLGSYRELRTSVPEAPPLPEAPLFLIPTTGVVEERPVGDARYFAPLIVRKRLRIQPLLTPDNYFDHVLPLVESATRSIDLQNQTLKWRHTNVDERFEQLMNTLLDKHRCGVEVRMILRREFAPEMKELLVQHGFSPDQIRLQNRCHTKGMIVDSQRVLLGSHNLSEHGALANRDASLIIDDEEVAGYFEQIFQFDWDRASTRVHETPPGISIYQPGDPIPRGYEVVSMYDAVL
jgi:phosphatidylserine/phosphatidylglycerophosphate/cardiolipin synthase-like enzyme